MVDVKDDGSVGDLRSDRYARDREPTSFTTLIAKRISELPEGRQRSTLRTVLIAHSRNQDRRAAVLKHPDLAKRMADAIGLARPEHWTGYIPAATVNQGDAELCRSVGIDSHGGQKVRFNQLGHRTEGEQPNTDPARPVLLEICAEAWQREHNPEISEITES